MYCPPVILQEQLMNKRYPFQNSAVIIDDAVPQMCFDVIRSYVNWRSFLKQEVFSFSQSQFVSFRAACLTH